jgi:hypothetical protein
MSESVLTKNDYYPLADWYGSDKRFRLSVYGGSISPRWLRAKRTGEKRSPRKGEWYLSGNPKIVYIGETIVISELEQLPD